MQQGQPEEHQHDGHDQRDDEPELQLSRRGRPDDDGRHREDRQRQQHAGGQQADAAERSRHPPGAVAGPDQDGRLDHAARRGPAGQEIRLAASALASCEVPARNQVTVGSVIRTSAQSATKLPASSTISTAKPERTHRLQLGLRVEQRDHSGARRRTARLR